MSNVLAILGIIVSLVGIPLTWILARRGRQRPDLRYVTDFDVLINPEDGLLARGLQMHFDDREIVRISRTLVAVWNRQGDTVRGVDVVPDDPLRLQLPEGDTALQARVVSISRPQTKVQCSLDPIRTDRVLLNFDFLDADDGVVAEILHQSAERPKMMGTIRGVTLKDDGSAALTSPALDAAASTYIRRLMPWRSLRLLIVYIFIFQSCVILTLLGYGLWQFAFHDSHLVPLRDYRLDTLDGQVKFAERVRDAQSLEWPLSLLAMMTVFALMLIYLTHRLWRGQIRALIPRTIVKIRKPMNQGGTTDEPASGQVQRKEDEAGFVSAIKRVDGPRGAS